MNKIYNKKKFIPIKHLRIHGDQITDLTASINHVRINQQVKLYINSDFADGTKVWVNAPDLFGSVENNNAIFYHGMAFFGNLRFKASSGRGNCVDLTVHVETEPKTVLCCSKFLKVTRDGPRIRKKKMVNDLTSVDDAHQSMNEDENECDDYMEVSTSMNDISVFNQLNIPKEKYEKYIQDLNEFTRNFVEFNNKINQVLTIDDINQIIHQVSFKMIKNLCKNETN